MNADELWHCPTCASAVTTPHCSACGERQPHPQELTVTGLGKQALEAFTSYDSRLLLTFRTLLRHPGSLTLKYLHGSRKPYLGPFALFLLANVLFVALEALTGSNIFATPLARHLDSQPWDHYAQQLLTAKLTTSGSTMDAYAPIFDRAVADNAKSFIFTMVLPFALLPAMLFADRRLPFATHLAYSLHFHAFMLTAISGALVIVWVEILLGGSGLASRLFDNTIALCLLLGCAVYLYWSASTVYQTRGFAQILQSAVMVLAAMVIFLGYRFLLLLYTLYTT